MGASTRRRGRTVGRTLLVLLGYGAAAGLLVLVLELAEYRFLATDRSLGLYAALVGVLFAGLGIWLGRSLRDRRQRAAAHLPAGSGGFARDEERLAELAITPRELEILELVAAGLSNRGIGERLFVSENTVKTHCRRLFDKLGARRRTQAVRIAREQRLIP